MAFLGTSRPGSRWCHAETELDSFLMVSYRVDPARLRRCLPSRFEPRVFGFDDGSEAGLVSAVMFFDRDFHFRCLPMFPVSCGQINYRVYGSLDGEPGVWFFGTSLDSPFVALPRLAWGMPWHHDRIRIRAEWDGSRPRSLEVAALGSWGTAWCEVEGAGRRCERLDGFADDDETLEVLSHPMTGWYQRGAGIGRYSVWHPVLEPWLCTTTRARFEVFERLGLVERGARPHSALAQRTVHFDVHTPPTRVRRRR